jgi:hypothetical protein
MSCHPASLGRCSPLSKNLLDDTIKIHDLIIYYIIYTFVIFYEKILGLSIKCWLVLINYLMVRSIFL